MSMSHVPLAVRTILGAPAGARVACTTNKASVSNNEITVKMFSS